MSCLFWLRAETKANEFRRAIVPTDCKKLIDAGHKVIVEDWADSIIPTSEYQNMGCEIREANSWEVNAPKEAIIVGLKALDAKVKNYQHTHIYFAHAYKEQDGWNELLAKFKKDGGRVIDLEYMVDNNGRRVAAFGYWAGYVGAAMGALFTQKENHQDIILKLKEQKRFKDKDELVSFVKSYVSKPIESIVIGCMGRSGSGAMDLLNSINSPAVGWDKEDTVSGGPFKEILNYDLFVNCILALNKMPPFITQELIDQKQKKLCSISDVSCDPDSDCNMVPVYSQATTLEAPITEVSAGVYLTAIDNLPSILPKESSEDFSNQLISHILDFNDEAMAISNALSVFNQFVQKV
jgi:alanine dehydrogenase